MDLHRVQSEPAASLRAPAWIGSASCRQGTRRSHPRQGPECGRGRVSPSRPERSPPPSVKQCDPPRRDGCPPYRGARRYVRAGSRRRFRRSRLPPPAQGGCSRGLNMRPRSAPAASGESRLDLVGARRSDGAILPADSARMRSLGRDRPVRLPDVIGGGAA